MATLKEFLDEWYSPSEYIAAHTSGSTGKPKDIRLLKADMRQSARATNAFFGLGKGSRAALPLSFDYIAGKMMCVRAEEGGYPLDILPVSNDIRLPEGTNYSIIPVVPSQLNSLIEQKEYASRIDNVLIGGAQPSSEICQKLADLGYSCYISYGMTETCSHVALRRATDSEGIYTAMPDISFRTDENDRLIIDAPNFSFGQLQTNDIVELLSPTQFRWRGRFDNAINSGGVKLLPEELENLYASFLPGLNFYIVGRHDEKWGECVCLVLEGKHDTEHILQLLRSTLDHKFCPKILEDVERLPRSPNGKIIRK